MTTVRVDVSPQVLLWARDIGLGNNVDFAAFPKFDNWISRDQKPTLHDLTRLAKRVGVPFGYMFLKEPPKWALPIPDFREGFDPDMERPSPNLMAVLNQSLNRQDWYREYAGRNDMDQVEIVGRASLWSVEAAASDMRKELHFEVNERHGNWTDTRKYLLRAFEDLGGLTVATSMVGNNTKRPLDAQEFRGFSLVDRMAPLVFVNTNQTLNGQIFTLAHEFAHIWRGTGGVGNEEPSASGQGQIERWCNSVASQFLVPPEDIAKRWPTVSASSLDLALDTLAGAYRCGTLVILQALRRYGLRQFAHFDDVYRREEERLRRLADRVPARSGGDHYNNQPYRVGERLSHAIIGDTLEGRTTYAEGMKLMSMRSATTFDEYARRLGAVR